METQRTSGLNKNVGFPLAAIIVIVGAIIEYYVMNYLDQNSLFNIVNASDVLLYYIVYDVLEVALIAGIFLVLISLAPGTVKSKKIGFALGALAGIVITALTIYYLYESMQNDGVSSDMVSQYIVALTLIYGGLYILIAGALGTGFAFLAQKSGMQGGPSTRRRSSLMISLQFIGLALALYIAFDLIMYYVGYPEPKPYVRWAVEGLFIVIGAFVINKLYRSMPEIAIPVAPTDVNFSSPAPTQVTVGAPVQAPDPVQVPVYVRSTAPAPAPAPVAEPTPAVVPAAPAPAPSQTQAQPAPAPAPGHRFCDQCGTENKIGAHFCAKCGNKLE